MSVGFKCYWCHSEWTSLTEVVTHLTLQHGDLCIKYREFILDESTGRKGYRTRVLPTIIPNKVKLEKKCITVKDGIVFITHTKDDIQEIIATTPLKTKERTNSLGTKHTNSCPKYQCVYCVYFTDSLDEIVEHCCSTHGDRVLRYNEKIPGSKKPIYVPKLHEGIIPNNITRAGSEVIVKNNCMVLIREKKTSNQKLNTPVKTGKTVIELSELDELNLDSNATLDTGSAFAEMEEMLPAILSTLFEHGKLDSYLKFNRLIHEKKMPMNNICFLLFNDLINWYSSTNTSQMRYQKETMKFWQLGYRLFHGKFIRFMTGLKNYGQVKIFLCIKKTQKNSCQLP